MYSYFLSLEASPETFKKINQNEDLIRYKMQRFFDRLSSKLKYNPDLIGTDGCDDE